MHTRGFAYLCKEAAECQHTHGGHVEYLPELRGGIHRQLETRAKSGQSELSTFSQ